MQDRSNFEQLRHQAKDLLRAARAGDVSATRRIHAVGPRITLASAQLALARESGFPSWAKLKVEVERRMAAHTIPKPNDFDGDDWEGGDDTDLPGFRGWTDQGTPVQEI